MLVALVRCDNSATHLSDDAAQEEMNKMQDVMEDLDMEYGVRVVAHG